jgi:ankyrin repeat protein
VYQEYILKFHKSVEIGNLNDVCQYFEFRDNLFIENLVDSKVLAHNQSVLHRAVLNQDAGILEILLKNRDCALKMDLIRDHCYRTPLHYAYGMKNNKAIVDLLLDYGFSENVFDKDGMSPLDFYERKDSVELQELILLHVNKKFDVIEPNPWSFHVWTRLQQEKDSSKQIMLFNNKIINHSHGHSHQHVVVDDDDRMSGGQQVFENNDNSCNII